MDNNDVMELLDIPLVLHGGTSISRDDLRRAASMGVGKVNYGTGMKRLATTGKE